ncbi:MAG: hypothetical protein AB7D47_10170 [Desulfovibrio sp.]
MAYGIYHIFESSEWTYRVGYVDLGEGQYYWAAAEIALGIFLLWLAWHKRHDHKTTHMICPQCESVFPVGEFQDGKCPHDGTVMEPMDGYYDRHPERRGKPLTENRD